MTKISVNTKIKAIEEYANGTTSLAVISAKYGVAKFGWEFMQDLASTHYLIRQK